MKAPKARNLVGTVLVALCGLHGVAAGETVSGNERFVAQGIVQSHQTKDRTLWIELVRMDMVFMVDRPATSNLPGLVSTLDAAAADARTVTMTYDLADGALESRSGRPIAILRSIRHNGVSVVGTKGPLAYPIASPLRVSRAAELALARGVALAEAARYAESIEALNDALGAGQLSAAARGLALKTRGNDRIGIIDATVLDPTPESDRDLIAAIRDFRAWRALAPDSAEPLYEEAYALRDLGAYEDALAVYREIAKDENERFWSSIRIGATYRQMGNLKRALSTLDELQKWLGGQEGMAFLYHRGWTFTRLGRFEEAEASFTKGLETQPDYAGAMFGRACARTAQGNLSGALEDQQAGTKAIEPVPGIKPTPRQQRGLDRSRAVVVALSQAVKTASKLPRPEPCCYFLEDLEPKRLRSPELAALAPKPATH